jgi:hypothetical protein
MNNIKVFYDNRNNRVFVQSNQPQKNNNNTQQSNGIQPNNTQHNNTQPNGNQPNGNQLLEINVKEFFEKFGSQYTPNIVEGPRGFPGLIGPQGPSGKGIDDQLLENLKTIVNEHTKPNRLQKNNIHQLLFGLKKTNIVENNNSEINSSSYFRIMKNNTDINETIYDTFYLSPNILEINDYSHFNYVHDRKVEKFQNNNKSNDCHYFPLEYIPSGFPINLNNNISNIVIQNISFNFVQLMNANKYEDFRLLGNTIERNNLVNKKISLNLHFELHSQVPYHLLSNRLNLMPYRNENLKVLNPSQTCIVPIKTIKINDLNNFYEDKIRIPIEDIILNHQLKNVLLAVRISLDKASIKELKGVDVNDKIYYGYVPFTQILVNCEYYLE